VKFQKQLVFLIQLISVRKKTTFEEQYKIYLTSIDVIFFTINPIFIFKKLFFFFI